jgi:hypothetical protein
VNGRVERVGIVIVVKRAKWVDGLMVKSSEFQERPSSK